MNRRTAIWTVIACIPLFFASTGSAATPVRQNIGMYDGAFTAVTEADCRVCHSSGLPDRHHNLYGTSTAGDNVPYPDADGDGNPDTAYVCLSCHDSTMPFRAERDCTVCHQSSTHHTTAAAMGGDCNTCHGVVTNLGGGYIPSYSPSMVTPSIDKGDGAGGKGGCAYCHDEDGSATPPILKNKDLHHGTGLMGDCTWCHVPTSGGPDDNDPNEIRACEQCHGPDSLHSIQDDSGNGGGVVVGGEAPGYGHVGDDSSASTSDCFGCHGFSTVGLAPFSGPTAPTVHNANRAVVYTGEDTLVVLNGSSLTNTTGGVLYESDGVLTAADGSSVTLPRGSIDNKVLAVTIPSDTAPGNYKLRAVKYQLPAENTDGPGVPVPSNPAAIQIIPKVSITDVTTSDGIVTIEGSGFAGYAEGSATSVTGTIGTTTVEATIVSWSDTIIKADFGAKPEEVTVNSVFGTDTYPD